MAEKPSSPGKVQLAPLAEKFLWVDKPAKVSLFIKGLIALCVLLVVLDFLVHRHAYFRFEQWYGFYAVSGFVAFTCIVLAAKNLRRLIGRNEDYYGQDAVDSEPYPEAGLDKQEHGPGQNGEPHT